MLTTGRRELGLDLELREIKGILGRADFENVTPLESHRSLLEKKLDRTQVLIAIIVGECKIENGRIVQL